MDTRVLSVIREQILFFQSSALLFKHYRAKKIYFQGKFFPMFLNLHCSLYCFWSVPGTDIEPETLRTEAPWTTLGNDLLRLKSSAFSAHCLAYSITVLVRGFSLSYDFSHHPLLSFHLDLSLCIEDV